MPSLFPSAKEFSEQMTTGLPNMANSSRVPTTTYMPPPQPQQAEEVDSMAFGRLGELGMTKEEEMKLANAIKRLYPRSSAAERYDMALKFVDKSLGSQETEDNKITNELVDRGELPEEQREMYPQQKDDSVFGEGGMGTDLRERLSPEAQQRMEGGDPTTPLTAGGGFRSAGTKIAIAGQEAGREKKKKGIFDKILGVAGNVAMPTTLVNTIAGGSLTLPNVPTAFQYKSGDSSAKIVGKMIANAPGDALNLGIDVTNALALNADDTLVGIKTIAQGLVEKGMGMETENTEIVNSVWGEMSGPYKDLFDGGDNEAFLEYLVEHPAIVLSDVVGVLSLGAGTVAKGVSITGKVSKVVAPTKAANFASQTTKVANSIKRAQTIFDKIDPAYRTTGILTTLGGRTLSKVWQGGKRVLEQGRNLKSGVTKETMQSSLAGGKSKLVQAERVQPEYINDVKKAVEDYQKDANKNPDPLMRGARKIEEAIDGSLNKPMERVGEQVGEIRKAVKTLPVDGSPARAEFLQLLEEKYNTKVVDGEFVPARGSKMGLPKDGAEFDIIKSLHDDLNNLVEKGGEGGDIERIFADINKKYKALDSLSEKGGLYDPLLKADLYDIRESLYTELDKYIDAEEFAKLKKEYGQMRDSSKRLSRLYEKAGKGPSGERLPTNAMLKKIFGGNPEEAKKYLEELSKLTGDDWVAKIDVLGTVAADLVEPNIFESVFDLRPSQVIGGSRFFRNDLADTLLKRGAKKFLGSPTEILEAYAGKSMDTLPESVQVRGFNDISEILEQANKNYAEGATKTETVDFISKKMDEMFADDIMAEEAATSFTDADRAKPIDGDLPFNEAGAAESAIDDFTPGQIKRAESQMLNEANKYAGQVPGKIRSRIGLLEYQNNTGKIGENAYSKQKDKLIEMIMEETGFDQFESRDIYDSLLK